MTTLEVYTIFGFEYRGFSDLKTLELYTIFGFENPGSVYYFRI